MTKKELRKISLQYRTLASQMLKVDAQEELCHIQAFFDFITNNEFLHDYINACHKTEYDFEDIISKQGWNERFVLPAGQNEVVDYVYQLIAFILCGKRQLFAYGMAYSSSNKFSDKISAFMRKVIEPFVVAIKSYLEISLIDATDIDSSEVNTQKTIFLSYCQKDSDIADLVEIALAAKIRDQASISRDIRDVVYHESFGRFMQSIQDHDYVIMLLSDRYLKSRNCMFEVLEAVKDNRYQDKLIYIVIDDEDKKYLKHPVDDSIAANVYNMEGHTKYTVYWNQQNNKLQQQIDEIGNPMYAIEQIKEQKIIARILMDLPDFLSFIRDTNAFSLGKHLSENFSSMCSFMGIENS